MKKNIIFIISISISLFILVILSYLVMFYNNGSKYKFNEDINKNDLINLYLDDEKLTICENCIYTCSNWDGEVSSSLLKEIDNSYETIDVYDRSYTTNLNVSLGDSYKKVLAHYGIKDDYAYWNVELGDGGIYFYDYPSDVVKNDDILNGYLNFVYYLDGNEWKLLEPSKYKNNSNREIEGIDEYILFTFEFSFNGYSEYVNDDTLAAYSIYYYKK